MKRLLSITFALLCACALGDEPKEVHVYQQTSAGGVVTQLSDETLLTGSRYSTVTAPKLSGYIFTHWSISRTQAFTDRDRLGRSLDLVAYDLYESTTLTANYLPESQDDDGDGIADGWEIYWYGSIDIAATSDSDNDGMTFAEELAAGTNPLIPNESQEGGVMWGDGALLQYNPTGLQSYTIRSEPEGELFETITDYVEPGTSVTTPVCNRLNSNFAYWTRDGVRVQDRRGRAVESVTFTMPDKSVEFVAVCIADKDAREQFYWYGEETPMTSDTDGDGMTLAEEIAAGTNPLMPNESVAGGVMWGDGELLQYNPDTYKSYVIRSEPEGELFATETNIVKAGTAITSPLCNRLNSNFAYWTLNGVRQQDRHGRAVDQVSFAMPEVAVELVAVCVEDDAEREQFYWYGANADMSSDTDGDGMTLAQEIAAGTNPLIANESVEGGVMWGDGEYLETDLQVYEQAQGAVVGSAFEQLFTSPVAGNGASSATFGNGGQIWPVIGDVNGDGLWDLVVCWEERTQTTEGTETTNAIATRVYLNVGSSGNPEFVVGDSNLVGRVVLNAPEESGSLGTTSPTSADDSSSDGGGLGLASRPTIDLAMNSTAKLAEMTLDVAPVNALSATTNGTTLLVSDTEGRIWLYERRVEDNAPYQLQHKVWGGSYAGFAEGLMLAAVDWEDDGDLDCICGTADGKLMLLRNPKVGRPTNVKALAGVDNVLLTWDPNTQSRVRGYRVYRAAAETTETTEGTETTGAFNRIAEPPLPIYRDFPGSMGSFDYKVSSISRFYTAGNSTPTVTESPMTEAVRATLGTVKFFWNDVVCKVGENANVMLSIENSLNYNVAGTTQTVTYDPEYLRPLKVAPTGLTEVFNLVGRVVPNAPEEGLSQWEITIESGDTGYETLPAGGGKFLTLVFETLKEGTTVVGGSLGTTSPTSGATVTITARSSSAPYQLGDVTGDGVVDVKDLRELAKLKNGNGRKYTANQLKAGDFNGNGKLDNADYQALRELLKERDVL